MTPYEYEATRSITTRKIMAYFWFLVAVGAVVLLALGAYYMSQRECLIYGIDFNGNNDPFGLFCEGE